ncbi:hypothetical protein D3C73_1273460 [compost metagenome]
MTQGVAITTIKTGCQFTILGDPTSKETMDAVVDFISDLVVEEGALYTSVLQQIRVEPTDPVSMHWYDCINSKIPARIAGKRICRVTDHSDYIW